jgi:hypothetical protein
MGRVGMRVEPIDRREFLRVLGFVGEKIPRDASGVRHGVTLPARWVRPPLAPWVIETPVSVRIDPTPRDGRRKSSKHRIYVQCPECRAWVPSGRFHQHYLTRVCTTRKGQL